MVRCGNCGEKQLWDECTTWRQCSACGSMVVLKTISQSDLEAAREAMKKALRELGLPEPKSVNVAYSDYTTYVLGIEDVERLKQLSREMKKKELEEASKRARAAKKAVKEHFQQYKAPSFARIPRRVQKERARRAR
ncbi:MAG: hypothetical protein ACP5O3_02610 [Candidatus Micrarchaeia archaeon]